MPQTSQKTISSYHLLNASSVAGILLSIYVVSLWVNHVFSVSFSSSVKWGKHWNHKFSCPQVAK